MPRKKKEPARVEVLEFQLHRLIVACDREFTGEISRMSLADITREAREVVSVRGKDE